MKTISIPEDLHKELMRLKLEQREKNSAILIKKLILAYKEKKFQEHSQRFRELLKKHGESFEDFLKEARKVKEEIVNEQFRN